MKINYKQKLFVYFLVIFMLFTAGIVLFEQSQEKKQKTATLEEILNAYTDMVNAAIIHHYPMDSILRLLPNNIRLSLIDRQGNVVFDNIIGNISGMENHAERPEIISAKEAGKGIDIRKSASNNREYIYFAKQFGGYYIRVALPYNVQVQRFLKSDNLFLYYIVTLFIIVLLLINYATNRFTKSLKTLKNFIKYAENNTNTGTIIINFPDDELGEIGAKIAQNYQQLKDSKQEIAREREKLLQHVYSSEEGICFFAADRTVEFYNGLFIQYLNAIADAVNSDPMVIFTDPAFEKIVQFLSNIEEESRYFETKIIKQGKIFAVYLNLFDCGGFEIIINNITKQETNRLLKQEMTGNITHELRTPITGIRGCLETILDLPLDSEKRQHFIQNAYEQVLALSELIQDMSLLTKIENVSDSFRMESVNICCLLEELYKEWQNALQEKNMQMQWTVTEDITVIGNKNLLYSIFRNLTDNAIRYAGRDVKILITQYNEDKDYYCFSYSDTGIGISDEHHLTRLFERFYRINEGRTRNTGGSGLGLSIVKNAILFHKGAIMAKNRAGGGLEFLFHLPKANK